MILSPSSILSTSHPFSFSKTKISAITTNAQVPTKLSFAHHTNYASSHSLRRISSNTLSTNSRGTARPAMPPQKYVYPDPIPEFAELETRKFRSELLRKLSKNREAFGGDLDNVVKVCAEILNEFLHKEYGGPGTLVVEPFTDMLVVLKAKKLPGAPEAARAALLWAQNYLDRDWETWNSQEPN
ncbi:hypothetical protein Syun_020670 [Stephania yunnanensis]|uniref:Protein PLASTID REDOX INSENSITIVE 2, chloroplastic-like n=1 Tax=Stephania yunnanensis TaxID=152371 RepID=A0AAP0NP37_9MAGN